MRQTTTVLQLEIVSKILRSGYHYDLNLDLRLDPDELYSDLLCLRQLQDLEYDKRIHGDFTVNDDE